MPGQGVINQDRAILKDVTVLGLVPTTDANVAGTAVDYIGVIETVEIEMKREGTDVTGSHDDGMSSRAVRWGNGSVRLTGFSSITGSKFAKLFTQGSHCALQFTEASTGDSYQLLCFNETFSKSMGKDANKDTLSLKTEGVPWVGLAGATIAAVPLTA